MKTNLTKQSGFTLIELVMVIVILGVLAAVALPKFVNLSSDARVSVIKGVAGSMRGANAMIYAKYQIAGGGDSVTIAGNSVTTAYGFAADTTELLKVMDLSPEADFTTSVSNEISMARAETPGTGCSVGYTAAINANTPPIYILGNAGTLTGC